MTPTIDITIEHESWNSIADLEALSEKAIRAAVRHAGKPLHADAEVSMLLCDDAHIRELNRDWRAIDKATNVLSFPLAGAAHMLGDIVVAYETVAREAQSEHKSFEAHYTHLVVHGLLHLLGFDHEGSADAEEMENLERRILASLAIADPYAERVREAGQ